VVADRKVIKYLLITIGAVVLLVVVVVGFWGWLYKSSELRPVGATATFGESADCLVRYGSNFIGSELDSDRVDFCFPTQTAEKKAALIACFNAYERNHPDGKGWPEDNMRGCSWDGLTAVPAPHVVSLTFGKVVAVPAEPRAGKHFLLTVGVTRNDSAAKTGQSPIEKEPTTVAHVTINGGDEDTDPEADVQWGFLDGKFFVRFTVPKAAEGKRLTIKMTIAADSPTATKVVTFTVGR
jgi:hypothetical protein